MAKQAVSEAESLLADLVGARQTVFTTCGSSISIHTAMLTVTGPGRKILVDRNEGGALLEDTLHRVNRLRDRLAPLDGLQVMDESIIGHDGVAEWDALKLSVDVSGLGITGYQAQEWLESEHRLTAQLGDTRRVIFSLTYSDDDAALDRLYHALAALSSSPPAPDRPATRIPALEELNLQQAMNPRDAYFARTEQVAGPAGRISAEMISPYPPGVPAILPGERYTDAVVDYLRSRLAAGMTLPDAADPKLETFRVVARD
jgi:arginine decarboxylase